MGEARLQKSIQELTKAEHRKVRKLYDKAKKGDKDALRAFENSFAEAPQGLEADGNLGRDLRRHLLDRHLGEDEVFKRGIELRAESLERDLAGDNPTPLERLLIERIVIAWVESHLVDKLCLDKLEFQLALIDKHAFYQKWQERCHRRFLSAVKTLAQVRKLLGMNVQINIAEQQVNVAG